MARSGISLREKDRKRLLKDQVAKAMVTCGGLAVLAALILIFVYLVKMVIPLFSSTTITPTVSSQISSQHPPLAIGINNSGQDVYLLSPTGSLSFFNVDEHQAGVVSSFNVSKPIRDLVKGTPRSGWLALVDEDDQVTLIKPSFTHVYKQKLPELQPEVNYFYASKKVNFSKPNTRLEKLAFSVDKGILTLVGYYLDGSIEVRWYTSDQEVGHFNFASHYDHVSQILVTPDSQTVYIRQGSMLTVAKRKGDQFVIRENVDLSQGVQGVSVRNVQLLAGAYSLIVTDQNGQISQWFDVLKNKQRSLTFIRSFKSSDKLSFILPDAYRKGFYGFYQGGEIKSYYTTTKKVLPFKGIVSEPPELAAMSKNEEYLVTFNHHRIAIAKVDSYAPEISFSSLWDKVWYESYPKPEYVWQTTSASHDYEAKFSLMPLTFGTLKAALFAMLFSLPIAVCGAIYTAYFMSAPMRRIVKPSIELMEALPTVIIGFLAGLWFAPIVESHLVAIVVTMLLLPPFIVLVGFGWRWLPNAITHRFPNGWHPLILMPLIALFTYLLLDHSGMIESWLFHGDIRVYLANHGIDFDQRNALVVGFAMGFAVIPTIFTIAEDAVFSVPKHLSDGSLALGATPWQTLVHVVLQTASPGIFSAIMMGLGRAVGETMIVIMATGNTPIMDWNILEGMRTLSATIAIEMPESEVGSPHYRLLFLAALILLMFTFAVNSLAEWVRQRLREKYRAM
ncbi:ABC transporter permease subunit [Vibrio sp. S4M6]|uniref:ABC transporter permease subunit n=1 Tax=Vibrio sinus TaxID=2946865 RepID=UPI00202A908B|nr:ABC transporter permease subunit [Vibrio sinus]MCL9782239.1 ABC transporter permease subunit [Vibrio sinus]